MNHKIKFLSCMFLGKCLDWEKGSQKIDLAVLIGKPSLEYFFSFFKHYSASSEVSLFLNVLINKVMQD